MDDKRRQALWLNHSQKFRAAGGRRSAGWLPDEPVTQPPAIPKRRIVSARTETPDAEPPDVVADRQLCSKCGKNGPLLPSVDRSPCCGSRVKEGDQRTQVDLRLKLWAERLVQLERAERLKRDRPTETWIRAER